MSSSAITIYANLTFKYSPIERIIHGFAYFWYGAFRHSIQIFQIWIGATCQNGRNFINTAWSKYIYDALDFESPQCESSALDREVGGVLNDPTLNTPRLLGKVFIDIKIFNFHRLITWCGIMSKYKHVPESLRLQVSVLNFPPNWPSAPKTNVTPPPLLQFQ